MRYAFAALIAASLAGTSQAQQPAACAAASARPVLMCEAAHCFTVSPRAVCLAQRSTEQARAALRPARLSREAVARHQLDRLIASLN